MRHMRQHGKAGADAATFDAGKTVAEPAGKYVVVDMGCYVRATRSRLEKSLGSFVCRHCAIRIRCTTRFLMSCSVLFSDFYSNPVASIRCTVFLDEKSWPRRLPHDFYLDRVDVTL
jgi:hypothetical protein